MKFKKTCPNCGKVFGLKYRSEFKRQKYCSKECQWKANSGSVLDWEAIVEGLAVRCGIEYQGQAGTIKAVYPSIYKNQIELAEVLGVSGPSLTRQLAVLGVVR